MSKEKLVVIGNGMAGARFVEEVVSKDGDDRFDISVFGEEPYGNYNRILLSGVISQTHSSDELFLNPMDWYDQNGVTLYAGIRALEIDTDSKIVHGQEDHSISYDKLVIATGSFPFIPPIEGIYSDNGLLREGVFSFRSLEDCIDIVQYASDARHAVVIGGGLLGLETTHGLINRGLHVDVVHIASHLMDAQLDADAGQLLQHSLESLEGMRVTFHLAKTTTRVVGDNLVTGVEFKDGSAIECDMVVIATGVRPNASIAKSAGLDVNQGILIDDDFSCPSASDIFAIGECAEHRGITYGLVAPAWEHATMLADRLTGRNPQAHYSGSRVSTKLHVMGIELAVAGDKEASKDTDEVVTYVEPSRGVYKKLIVRDDHIAGAILLGDGATTPRLLQSFNGNEKLPADRAAMLFPIASDTVGIDVSSLSDNAQICDCNGVSKGQIVSAVNAGNRNFKSVCNATRAGTGCGSCKPQIDAILEFAAYGLVADDPSAHYYVPGIPMSKSELMHAVKTKKLKSVSAVFKALADGKEDAGSKAGLASLLKTIWDDEYEDERDARFINDRVHANIQRDGTFSVVPRIFGGITSPDELRRIANVAEKYNAGMVKVTGGQRIDILGIPKEHLPDVWRELDMPSGHAYAKAFRTCKTCVGTDFCRFGLGDSTSLGIDIEKRFQGIEMPHKVKMAVSGCPRNCAEATVKDVGIIAIDGGKWEIYIGGAAGANVRKGDVLAIVDSADEALKHMGRFLQYYRENAKYLERTYDFVERIGIERVKEVLIDDTESIADKLDADMNSAIDAYVNPWQEGSKPLHPSQFVSVSSASEVSQS